VNEAFRHFSDKAAQWAGSPWFFTLNIAVVLAWLAWGAVGGFSDTMQLVMTTGLTVTTQLLVILVQSTQNRDARAVHLKLDELIRALVEARTEIAQAEDMAEDEVERAIDEIKGSADAGAASAGAP
jgi:low affinity Fe/Cu permease